MMKSKEKIFALLLSLTITLTFMPSAVFAVEEAGGAPTVENETADNAADGEGQVSEPAAAEVSDAIDASAGQKNLSMEDEEELLEGFFMKEAELTVKGAGDETPAKNTRGSKLKGNDKVVYDELRSALEGIARGESESAVINVPVSLLAGGQTEFTAEDLGVESIIDGENISNEAIEAFSAKFYFDVDKVITSLIADMPYDLYWFDKVKGWKAELTDKNISAKESEDGVWRIYFKNPDTAWSFKFFVAEGYSKTGAGKTTDINKEKTATTGSAAEKAAEIVKNYSGRSDFQKLKKYKDEICGLVTYENDGLDPDTPYGDIWQVIYVFDGDETTNVVCEGYSKAFKVLCDLSEFRESELMSHIVSGNMEYGPAEDRKGGPHMWNIVHMGDSKNYLVDVTNCDDEEAPTGSTDDLFMKGCSAGTDGFAYVCSGISYSYNDKTRQVYEESELQVSDTDYDQSRDVVCVHDMTHTAEVPATCTKDGVCEFWHCSKCERDFADSEGNRLLKDNEKTIPAHGHSWDAGKVTAQPTGYATGVKTFTCTKCNATREKTIAKLPAPSVKISKTSFTWNKKVQKPTVKVTSGKEVLGSSDYTVKYSNPKSKNVGAYTVTVAYKGRFRGSQKLTYTIVPKGTKLTGASAQKKAAIVKWAKQTSKMSKARVTGYEIQYSRSKSFKSGNKSVKVKGYGKTSGKVAKLASKKTYYFRVRTYMKSGGKTYCSGWSGVKAAKIK